MAMKLSKKNLCINQIIEQKDEKIVIEGDEIVPDIKPDALSIVYSNGNICIYKKEIQDGKIKIEGYVNIYVTYIADDEKSSMRAINTNLSFSKSFEMKKIKSNMQLQCKAELANIECKILNGRKINVKTDIKFNFTTYSNLNIKYIDSIEKNPNMQILNEKMSINELIGTGSAKAYAKDTIIIDNVDNLLEVMKVEISLLNKENKISYNKVLTKADAVFKILYLTEDGRINSTNATIPVMGFIDMQDLSEDNICDVLYEIKNMIIKPNNIEEHSIHVEAEIEILSFVYKQQEINLIKDLYGRKNEIEYTKRNIKAIKEMNELGALFNMKKQEKIEEIMQNKICDFETKVRILNTKLDKGKVIYQGEVNLIFIYKQIQSSRINIKNLVEPFEFSVDAPFITSKTIIETNIEVLKKNCMVLQDNILDVDVDIQFNIRVNKESEINLIEKIEETNKKKEDSYSIVIYYTKEGDTLWEIAKSFGSTVDEIVKINCIENPNLILQGEQLFIPR